MNKSKLKEALKLTATGMGLAAFLSGIGLEISSEVVSRNNTYDFSKLEDLYFQIANVEEHLVYLTDEDKMPKEYAAATQKAREEGLKDLKFAHELFSERVRDEKESKAYKKYLDNLEFSKKLGDLGMPFLHSGFALIYLGTSDFNRRANTPKQNLKG